MSQSKLSKLLKDEGLGSSETEISNLVRGVAAAPDGFGRDAWLTLLDPPPSPKLRSELETLKKTFELGFEITVDSLLKISQIRDALRELNLDGIMVPRTDEYQGEYVSARAQRVAWLTGFTGSAGTAIVLKEKALIFVDGRYTLQAREQVDQTLFEIVELAKISVNDWIQQNLSPNTRLGYDPQLHTRSAVQSLAKACSQSNSSIVPIMPHPIDSAWLDQPPPPLSPVMPHNLEFSGQSLKEKCAQCGSQISMAGADAAVLTLTDSICWLLNIRGADVEFTPVSLGFAILHKDSSAELFIDKRKLTGEARRHLGNSVTIREPDQFFRALQELGTSGKKIQVDPLTTSEWVFQSLGNDNCIVEMGDPCIVTKAVKNSVELDGARAAHLRDGVAVTTFLHWMSQNAEHGNISEIDAATRLEDFRSIGENFRGLSFPTISGTGPNGAIVHYRVDLDSNRVLSPEDLYLVDSGAQYLDGTTDVTRTIAVGKPTDEMRDRFTRVLKGHIAIATTRFPVGTNGGQLDSLARLSLWEVGLDFQHGTGHGVGSFLSVHEGPQRISKAQGGALLRPGMIVSNEPGYYKSGSYGIRIENLLTVVSTIPQEGMAGSFLEFETLTLAPIDQTLIVKNMLDDGEKQWVNIYHALVYQKLARLLEPEVRDWLKKVTLPI